MRRSLFGLGLLLALLALCWAGSLAMDRIHRPIAQDLEQAAQYAMENQWDQADTLYTRALSRWHRWDHFRSCLADHAPVEEIEADAACLYVYAKIHDGPSFAAACRQLSRQVQAVGEAHGLLWWNLL